MVGYLSHGLVPSCRKGGEYSSGLVGTSRLHSLFYTPDGAAPSGAEPLLLPRLQLCHLGLLRFDDRLGELLELGML